jgi:hypothetical protein
MESTKIISLHLPAENNASALLNELISDEYDDLTPLTSALLKLFMIILFIIFVLSLLLNSLSILSIVHGTGKLTPIKMLIFNLAVADLIYTLGIPMFIFSTMSRSWNFGLLGCRLFFLTEFTGIICSVLTITLLSVERFFDITEFKANRTCQAFTRNKVLIYIGLIWLVAGIFITPLLFSMRLASYKNTHSCASEWSDVSHSIYFVFKCVLIFIVPYTVIVMNSVKLLCYLNKWSMTLNRSSTSKREVNPSPPLSHSGSRHSQKSPVKTNSNYLAVPTVQYQAAATVAATPSSDKLVEQAEVTINLVSVQSDFESAWGLENMSADISQSGCGIIPGGARKSFNETVRRKAVRLVLAIMIVFLVQWSPVWTFQFYQMAVTEPINHLHLINTVITVISYSNTVANPLLYMLLTYNFKQYLKTRILNNIPAF